MEAQSFSRTVFVRDTAYDVCEISCVTDALRFLARWPVARRGPIYYAASRACQAAREGNLTADAARSAIICWARSAAILEQAPVVIEPWMVVPKRGGEVPI